jgi:GntR family transcriptional regulator
MAEGPREKIKYRRISEELSRDIRAGAWKVGDRIPSEPELAQTYGVSRGTVRNAVEQLVNEGMLRKEQGRGTFVISTLARLRKDLGWLASFTSQLHEGGIRPSTRVLEAGLIPAGEAEGIVREAFRLTGSDDVICIRRLRLGNDTPYAIQTVYLLPDKCPGILDESVDLTQLFKLYAERYDVRIIRADERICVATAGAEEATLLQIAPGEPVVIRDRVSMDQQEYPFEVLHSVDLGDLFEYRYQILADSTRMIK